MKRILMVLLCFITVLSVSCDKSVEFKRNEHADNWITDLETMKNKLPNVAAGWTDDISKSEWNDNIDKLIEDINAKTMSDIEIKYRIDEILMPIKDGHLNFECGYNIYTKIIPIYFKITSNKDFYVGGVNKENEQYLGSKIISINDIDIDDIVDKIMEITPHDNQEFVYANLEAYGFDGGKLKYLGIGKDVNKFKFETVDGEIVEHDIELINYNEFKPIFIVNKYENKLLRNDKPSNALNEYWYKIDEDNDVFYFQYNKCEDKTSEYSSNKNLPYFEDFTSEMVEYMKENDEKFNTIIIDLRNNTGGDPSLLLNYYIKNNIEYLNQKDIKILVGKRTFSAGISAINDLYDNLNIKSYGTETGGLIGGYTVRGNLFLNSTGSSIFCSIQRANYNPLTERQEDEWSGFIPDVIVEDTAEDFIQGIDRVYEEAVKDSNF